MTSISENNKIITNLSVFPNPANELTTLAISLERTKQVKITIVDLLGKEI